VRPEARAALRELEGARCFSPSVSSSLECAREVQPQLSCAATESLPLELPVAATDLLEQVGAVFAPGCRSNGSSPVRRKPAMPAICEVSVLDRSATPRGSKETIEYVQKLIVSDLGGLVEADDVDVWVGGSEADWEVRITVCPAGHADGLLDRIWQAVEKVIPLGEGDCLYSRSFRLESCSGGFLVGVVHVSIEYQ